MAKTFPLPPFKEISPKMTPRDRKIASMTLLQIAWREVDNMRVRVEVDGKPVTIDRLKFIANESIRG